MKYVKHILTCVEGILVDVAMGQVAAPGCCLAFTNMQVDGNGNFRLGHDLTRYVLVILGGHTLLHHLHIANENIICGLVQLTTTGTKSSDNTSPVGISSRQCALPQRRQRNCSCRLDRISLVLRSARMYSHKLGSPF